MKIELTLTPSEHAAWLRAAGSMPLAEWIRVRCNEQAAAARVRALVVKGGK